jgi:site-specific DNA recombinase
VDQFLGGRSCALTGEIKKGGYVYYHCTGHKGKCPEKYVREEELADQFGDALQAIKLDGEVLSWIITALKGSHKDEKRYHDEMIANLQKQYSKLQGRLDAMYIDKLDGKIAQDFFDRKSEEWRREQADILRKIEKHQNAKTTYLEGGGTHSRTGTTCCYSL